MAMAMAMATCGRCGGGGDRRRLLVPQKKVWRQVIRNTEQQQGMGDKIINIPNDIVLEILLRLPAKSLARLRWTCKYWFDLITRNPYFAKMHIHRCSTTTISNISLSVLSTCYKCDDDLNKLFQCYLNYNDTTRVGNVSSEVSIALPYYHPPGCRPDIMGSCNGLILLYELGDNFCIWNPCTKEYRFLPHPLRNTYVCREEGCNYGFGYDHINDDYKVRRNAYYKLVGNDDLELHSDVQVYTLGTNSWRRIGSNPYRLRTHRLTLGVFVNGALYWIDYLEENIISFDLGTEKFRHVSEIPNLTTAHSWFYVTIHMFEGSVCVVKVKNKQKCSEVWVMKDYAVNNNEVLWTKLSTIQNSSYRVPLHRKLPLKYTRNGKILMLKNDGDLFLYDQKNNNAKTLCRLCKKSTHIVEVVYAESLVSLNSGTYKGQERPPPTTIRTRRRSDDGIEETIFLMSDRYSKWSV